GGMVKTGGAGSRRRAATAFPGVQAEMVVIPAGRDESRTRSAGGERKTQHPAIEIEGPLQIGDFEMDMANADAPIDRWPLQGLFLEGFRVRYEFVLAAGDFHPHM